MESSEKLTLQELFDAGLHYGHQRRRWNPRMDKFIHSVQKGVHILDLAKTRQSLLTAAEFLKKVAADGGEIVFVGSKRQAKEIIRSEAERAGVHHITERWIGGFLTNFNQVKKNLQRLNELSEKVESGEFDHYTKKERLLIDREIKRLEQMVGGVRRLTKLPDALVLASARKSHVAVAEANIAGVPLVAVVDTNADPTPVDYPIPANDDSRRSLALIFKVLADAVISGRVGSGGRDVSDVRAGTDVGAGGDLSSLDLSARSQNALKKAGITSVEKLKTMSKEELLDVKGLGKKSVGEIVEKLS